MDAGACERRIFGEEAVTGMNRVDLVFAGDGNDAVDVEIGFDGRLAGADEIGFVRFEAMQAEAIFLGIDGNGAQIEFGSRAEYADGDFAAIGSEKATEWDGCQCS